MRWAALAVLLCAACSDPPLISEDAGASPSDARSGSDWGGPRLDARPEHDRPPLMDAAPPPELDAAITRDARVEVDVGADLDMTPDPDAVFDLGVPSDLDLTPELDTAPARDAAPELDARDELDATPLDAAIEADMSWGACASGGVAGACLQIDDCPAEHRRVQGLCPGPWDIQCCLPEAGPEACDPWAQPNEGLAEPPGLGGCPAGMAPVAGFCMDRVEASLVDLEGAPWSPFQNPGDEALVAAALPGGVPQGYIDGHQADAACARAGKRLCSDEEWLRACQGEAGRTFPYEGVRDWGRCNDHRDVHPAVELHPEADNPFAHIQDPCLNQLADGLAEAGAYEGCVTPEGIYDLVGNLHEWTANPDGVFRGGFYVDTERNGPGCLYRTTAHNQWHWDYSTGFRCCADLP